MIWLGWGVFGEKATHIDVNYYTAMRALTHTGEPKDALAPSWYLSAADDDNVTPDMTGLRGHWWAEGKPCYTGPAARTLVCTVAHSHVCTQAHSHRAPCVQARSQDSTPHKTRSVTPRPVRRAQGVSVTSRATFAAFGDFFCDIDLLLRPNCDFWGTEW